MWCYQGDSELMILKQLRCLLYDYNSDLGVELFLSYLPYARQDKPIAPNVCFGLIPFAQFLNELDFDHILILDPHSDAPLSLLANVAAIYPYQALGQIIEVFKPTMICYPDAGAYAKYKAIYGERFNLPIIHVAKERNPITGAITIQRIVTEGHEIEGQQILIIDDICDGGATFIQLTHKLKEHGCASVDLFVTHGLFTKGTSILHLAGIRNIWAADRLMGLREISPFNGRV
jgi:ribose-phosphate pyrophosphokinase